MFRATTFLIVLALAGAPAASLACDLWCASPSAQEHQRIVGCHSDSAGAVEGRQIAAVSSECHDAVSGTPFLTEVRSHTTTPIAALLSNTPLHLSVRNGDRTPTRAHAFEAPAPGGTLPTVLRI